MNLDQAEAEIVSKFRLVRGLMDHGVNLSGSMYRFRQHSNEHTPPKPLDEKYAALSHYIQQFNHFTTAMAIDLKTGSGFDSRSVAGATEALDAINNEAQTLTGNGLDTHAPVTEESSYTRKTSLEIAEDRGYTSFLVVAEEVGLRK